MYFWKASVMFLVTAPALSIDLVFHVVGTACVPVATPAPPADTTPVATALRYSSRLEKPDDKPLTPVYIPAGEYGTAAQSSGVVACASDVIVFKRPELGSL
jgi:hypothetical protein